jgi:hypothetical protein
MMGYAVKEIVPTPNPNATKFVLDREIASQPVSFLTPESGRDHPLAGQLFQIEGVISVLLLGNFVTINKVPEAKWPPITRKIQKTLQNFD